MRPVPSKAAHLQMPRIKEDSGQQKAGQTGSCMRLPSDAPRTFCVFMKNQLKFMYTYNYKWANSNNWGNGCAKIQRVWVINQKRRNLVWICCSNLMFPSLLSSRPLHVFNQIVSFTPTMTLETYFWFSW